MKISKNALSLLLSAALIISSLSACGKNADTGQEITPVTKEKEYSVSNTDKTDSPTDTPVPAQTVNTSSEDETTSSDAESQAEFILQNMSVRQKLAQMMIVALRSDSGNSKTCRQITPEYADILRKYDFGGIILFTGNIESPEQTVNLIYNAQNAALESEMSIPMFVCVDQEGGIVNRISYGTTFPGNMALAATGNPDLTEECAYMIGQEISALGFNMDFAPVSDVNNNPSNPIIGVRSFSDDPQIVSANVCSYIRGLDNAGISASLKHFPGHGNVGEDSHTGLPKSELTLDGLRNCELIPFQAGIDSGADMIMTAHIQYPNIETGTYRSIKNGKEVYLPATLSRTIITGLLREEMGYNGIIITDAMDMGAIADNFNKTDAAALAINVGVDILLCPLNIYQDNYTNTFGQIENYITELEARVESGEISEEEIDDSVRRILALKIERQIMDGTNTISPEKRLAEASKIVGCPEHHNREWEITTIGLTLLKNDNAALPVIRNGDEKTLILIPSEKRRPSVEYALQRISSETGIPADNTYIICYNGITINNAELQNKLSSCENVLILSQSSEKNDLVCKIIDTINQKDNSKVTLISLNLPYDAACYENADAILCAYNPYGNASDYLGNGPFNLNVSAAVYTAFGLSVPQGTLPVDIPGIETDKNGNVTYTEEILFKRGTGLKNWG